jgi:hypothetical protein
MRNIGLRYLAMAGAVALLGWGLPAGEAAAQKIICWKDKSGKTVGCGDKVPPEFEDSATRELDKRGVTRKTTETAEERTKREAKERAEAAQKAEEKKRIAEQRRQDAALINTFSDEKEIDLKRDRDLQVVDTQLTQMRVAHKNATDREKDFSTRIQTSEKTKSPASDYNKEELARAQADKAKAEQGIAAKEKEKEDVRKRYAEMKQRYNLLRGGGPAPTAAVTPAKK